MRHALLPLLVLAVSLSYAPDSGDDGRAGHHNPAAAHLGSNSRGLAEPREALAAPALRAAEARSASHEGEERSPRPAVPSVPVPEPATPELTPPPPPPTPPPPPEPVLENDLARLVASYFPDDLHMVSVCRRESAGWRSDVVYGPYVSATNDRGICQINAIHADMFPGYGWDYYTDVYDPVKSLTVVRQLYDDWIRYGGGNPWAATY